MRPARAFRNQSLIVTPGRTRVHSHIQNVLIVTKARDNRLIKLTRELALYLMLRPSSSNRRGMVVYAPSFLCICVPADRRPH